jgi:lipopolysaccharide assembly protein A
MKVIERLIAVCLFVVLFGFAIVNTAPVDLKFLGLDISWKAPLVVFLLLFFAAGVALGLLAVVPTWFRQKREIARLKKHNKKLEAAAVAPPVKPAVAPSAVVLNQPPIPF